MILILTIHSVECRGKPRASGDDPARIIVIPVFLS